MNMNSLKRIICYKITQPTKLCVSRKEPKIKALTANCILKISSMLCNFKKIDIFLLCLGSDQIYFQKR